jgi:5-methyltetrahydropteroyltriglutamate--homocysteine methyltransferase
VTRILTTHVGSLPRPPELVELVWAEDRGEPVDRERYARLLAEAVRDRVRHQVEAGIDFVSDGEMSKIGYATYIRHRLSGFEVGDVPRATPADLDAFPRYRDRLAQECGSARYLRPICRGPITCEHAEPLQRDLGRLADAVDGQPIAGAFMNAPSPGIIALFQPNEYYPSLDDYLDAIGEAMKSEYEAIVAAGFQLQIDAPDLAMGRHIMYRDRSDEEFVAAARRHVEAINRALRDVPADKVRLHLCWGAGGRTGGRTRRRETPRASGASSRCAPRSPPGRRRAAGAARPPGRPSRPRSGQAQEALAWPRPSQHCSSRGS